MYWVFNVDLLDWKSDKWGIVLWFWSGHDTINVDIHMAVMLWTADHRWWQTHSVCETLSFTLSGASKSLIWHVPNMDIPFLCMGRRGYLFIFHKEFFLFFFFSGIWGHFLYFQYGHAIVVCVCGVGVGVIYLFFTNHCFFLSQWGKGAFSLFNFLLVKQLFGWTFFFIYPAKHFFQTIFVFSLFSLQNSLWPQHNKWLVSPLKKL